MSFKGKFETEKVLRGRLSGFAVIDKTLSVEGACADSKAVGDAIANLRSEMNTDSDEVRRRIDELLSLVNGTKENAEKAQNTADKAKKIAEEAKAALDNVREDLDRHISDTAERPGIEIKTFSVTIGTEWMGEEDPYSQTIEVPGILEKDNPVADLRPSAGVAPTDDEEFAFAQIRSIKIEDGSITVYARDKTTTPITIQMEVHRLGGNLPGGDAEVYDGTYTVTPSTEEQVLDTSGKLMLDDVRVKAMPSFGTSDPALEERVASLEKDFETLSKMPGPEGPQGPAGPKGDKGDEGPAGGFAVTAEGMIGIRVDDDGNLLAVYHDEDSPPQLKYNDETGELFYVY